MAESIAERNARWVNRILSTEIDNVYCGNVISTSKYAMLAGTCYSVVGLHLRDQGLLKIQRSRTQQEIRSREGVNATGESTAVSTVVFPDEEAAIAEVREFLKEERVTEEDHRTGLLLCGFGEMDVSPIQDVIAHVVPQIYRTQPWRKLEHVYFTCLSVIKAVDSHIEQLEEDLIKGNGGLDKQAIASALVAGEELPGLSKVEAHAWRSFYECEKLHQYPGLEEGTASDWKVEPEKLAAIADKIASYMMSRLSTEHQSVVFDNAILSKRMCEAFAENIKSVLVEAGKPPKMGGPNHG